MLLLEKYLYTGALKENGRCFAIQLVPLILPDSFDSELVLRLLYYSVLWYLLLFSSLIFHLNE